MKADLYSVLRLSVPAVQVGIAPPEDRALRGRNLSAGLEPDKRQVGPLLSVARLACPCRNLPTKAKNPRSANPVYPLCSDRIARFQTISFKSFKPKNSNGYPQIHVHFFG